MKPLYYFTLTIGLLIVSSYKFYDFSKRYYSDTDYLYEFHIDLSKKKIKLKEKVTYYWYKSKQIQSNTFGFDGKLLHGTYSKKTLKTKQLIENGLFKYGIKKGLWKKWHLNGKLATIENWKKGLKNGDFKKFNLEGKIVIQGKYKDDKKTGVWIDYQKKDTLFYKNGLLTNKNSFKKFVKSIFKKGKKSKRKDTSTKENKQSFWKKIFGEKTKKSK